MSKDEMSWSQYLQIGRMYHKMTSLSRAIAKFKIDKILKQRYHNAKGGKHRKVFVAVSAYLWVGLWETFQQPPNHQR